jgi:hypothetical protein
MTMNGNPNNVWGQPDSSWLVKMTSKKYGQNLQYIRGGQPVVSSGNFLPLDNALINPDGTINLTSNAIAKQGTNAQSVSEAGFAFTATSTSITLYWDGTNGSQVIVQRRSDHSRQVIPPGSITVSGLSPSTRYYFLPFWVPANSCQVGWAHGTVGVPAIAFLDSSSLDAIQSQNFQDREPLSGSFMYADTPASGSGGGGTGGGGTRCVMQGTDIETLGDSPYSTQIIKCNDWWHICVEGGHSLNCTPNHPLYTAQGNRIEAQDVKVGMRLTHKEGDLRVLESYAHRRACSKIHVVMETLHLFYANGFLSHNYKIADV